MSDDDSLARKAVCRARLLFWANNARKRGLTPEEWLETIDGLPDAKEIAEDLPHIIAFVWSVEST